MFGITAEDFLFIEANRSLIERYIGEDPVELALKSVPKAVCTQIKYLSRCRVKIPDYYHARCVIPPLSYEQSSSAFTADSREYSGALCVDLTCGLGVDAYYLSKRFQKVITIEQDPLIADIARSNFRRLGADNITVVTARSEEFLEGMDFRADLIFADPARRDHDRRVFAFEACSPDVVALLGRMKELADKIVIKASPMFDVKEAFRVFGPQCGVETVSLNGECKELIIEVGAASCQERITVVSTQGEVCRYVFDPEQRYRPQYSSLPLSAYRYAVIPDVAFVKNRRVADLFGRFYPALPIWEGSREIALLEIAPETFPGKVFEIDEIMEYQPKKNVRVLRERGITSATIFSHYFPVAAAEVRKQLRLREGSGSRLLVAALGSGTAIRNYLILLK